MNYVNWRISNRKNELPKFRATVKEPTEGYKKEEWEFGDKSGTSYAKYTDTIKGNLSYVNTETVEFKDGRKLQQLKITVIDGDTSHSLQIPLKTSKGRANNYFKSAVLSLGSLVHGKETEIGLNTESKNNKGYLYENIYFKGFSLHLDRKDAPDWEKITEMGEEKWDTSKENNWYYEKCKEGIKAFLSTKPQSSSSTQEPYQKPEPQVENQVVGDDEDDLNLPF